MAATKSRLSLAIVVNGTPFGHTAVHSPVFVHPPNPASSCAATILSTRLARSGWPCGCSPRWVTFAAVNSIAEPFRHAATHGPQPMHAAASNAASASGFGTGSACASGALPVGAEMKPPAWMMRPNALRSTTRSFTTGKALARHGATSIVSPSLNSRMCSWQAVVAFRGPCGTPLMTRPHAPQMPSRQSWSNATGSSPSPMSRSLSTSSTSRNDMSGETSSSSYATIRPRSAASFCRQVFSVSFMPVARSLVGPLDHLHVLVLQDLLVEDRRGAGVLPGRDVGEVLVVAQRLAVRGLGLGAEVTAAGLGAVQGVDAHQLGQLEE